MKQYSLAFLLITIHLTLFGQSNDIWFSFWNKDTTLIGYKDKNGIVRIEPKFTAFVGAGKFDNIIATSEEINGKWTNYHLTKAGRIVGRDSLYIWDNTPDCESEGFIRFRDSKTDKTGMFNRNGVIIIPAEYNELTSVRNGMVIGLKDAQKKYWDKHNHSGCNHFSWSGGKEVLIDTANNILVDNFSYPGNLNLFSLKRTETPVPDTTRKSFLAKEGDYYSFVDFEKEFRNWLLSDLFINLTVDKLISASYDTITWESTTGWARTNKQQFIKDNFDLLKTGLLEIRSAGCDYFISSDGLNPYMYEGNEFEKYYDNCGNSRQWIYPVMTIIISHKNNKDFSQNHYEFLRTDDGYKLISVTIRNGKIK